MKTRIITLFTLLIMSLSQVMGQTLRTPIEPAPGARRIFVETFDGLFNGTTYGTTSDPKVWGGWTDSKGNTAQGLDAKYDLQFPEYKIANPNFKFMNMTFVNAMPGPLVAPMNTNNNGSIHYIKNHASTDHPENNEYVLAKSTVNAPYSPYWWGSDGHPLQPYFDHTYDHTGQNNTTANNKIAGYMLVVNANSSGDVFFTCPISDLCQNTHLIFRVYIGNLLVKSESAKKSNPNIQFEVLEPGTTPGTIGGRLKYSGDDPSYNGLVPQYDHPTWVEKRFEFNTGNYPSIILKISDIQDDTNGNDLVIDDIEVWLAPPVETIVNPTAYCIGDGITLYTSYNHDDVKAIFGDFPEVQWFRSTDPNLPIEQWDLMKGGSMYLSNGDPNPDVAKYWITDAAVQNDAKYYYKTVIGNMLDPTVIQSSYKCEGISDPFHFTLAPQQHTLFWKLSPVDQNWNNPANWMDAAGNDVTYAPSHCTDVHIPGNATLYPSLDVATSGYHSACNDIWFHFGGMIGKPHLLEYNYAYVQYNFGTSATAPNNNQDYGYGFTDYGNKANSNDNTPTSQLYSTTPMKRGQWYALAAPLQKIASGDFCVSGFPATWQQAFKSTPQTTAKTYTSAEWFTPENTNSWDIGQQYNAIAVWAGETGSGLPYGEGPGYQTNLNSLFGIMEMPYFENSAIKKYRPLFSQSGSTSSFQYYYENLPGLDPVPASVKPYGTIKRGPEAYRFIFQGPPFTGPNGAPGDSIYTMPLSTIAGTEIMVGNPFFSQLDFDAFTSDNTGITKYRLYVGNNFTAYSSIAGSASTTGNPTGTDQYIAPLQAFFIATPANGQLVFNADKVALADPFDNKMRAASASGSNMKPDVIYMKAESPAGRSYLTLSMQEVNDENLILLLPQGYPEVPQIYATDETGQKNSIQFEGGYVNSVPLGVLSTDSAVVTLTVQNADNLAVESLVLWDKYLDKKIDLKANDTYTFKNVPSVSDRFELIAGNKVITGMPAPEVAGTIRANITGNTLYVTAASGISEVSVISLEGITLSKVTGIGQNTYTQALSIPAGAYLVSVKTANGETKVVKIVNR